MSERIDRAATWVATGLGVGWVTPAPGTIGGLWGLPLAWAVAQLPTPAAQVAAIACLLAVSVGICTAASRALGDLKDPGEIVLDEIAVLPIVFLGVTNHSPGTWLLGWLLFRLFDITKPPPVRQAERLPQGWGIVADDALAAGYACLALHGLLWLDQAAGWNRLVAAS